MFRNLFARFSYIIIFALMVLAFIFYRSYFLLVFLIFMVVFPMVTIPLLYVTKKHISVNIDVPSIVEKNAPVTVNINIANTSYVPVIQSQILLKVNNSFYPDAPEYKLICGISAKKGASISFTINPAYCGLITISAEELRCWDFTGMADFRLKEVAQKEMSVMPIASDSSMELSMVGGAGLVELSEQENKGNDASTIIDTRDYQPGDKLQRIHWKLSTKLDKLLVKEYGSLSSQDVLVILEISHGSFAEVKKSDVHIKNRISFDSVFDSYATLAAKLLSQKRPFMVGWHSQKSDELKILDITSKEEFTESVIQMYYEVPSESVGAAKTLASSVLDEYGAFLYIHPCLPTGLFETSNEKNIVFENLSPDNKKLSVISIVGQI